MNNVMKGIFFSLLMVCFCVQAKTQKPATNKTENGVFSFENRGVDVTAAGFKSWRDGKRTIVFEHLMPQKPWSPQNFLVTDESDRDFVCTITTSEEFMKTGFTYVCKQSTRSTTGMTRSYIYFQPD